MSKFMNKGISGSPRDKTGPTPKQNKWRDPFFVRSNIERGFGSRSPLHGQYKTIMRAKLPVIIKNGAVKDVKAFRVPRARTRRRIA